MTLCGYSGDCGVRHFSGEVNLDESCSEKELSSMKWVLLRLIQSTVLKDLRSNSDQWIFMLLPTDSIGKHIMFLGWLIDWLIDI